jgi:large subunit ribosomal protein L22
MNTLKNVAKSVTRNIPYSPYKLRPIVDIIRNKNIDYALKWLHIYRNRRTVIVKKALESALANARNKQIDSNEKEIFINEIKVDQGLIRRYFKPGAQGRVVFQRRRHCHLSIIIGSKEKNKKNLKNDKE